MHLTVVYRGDKMGAESKALELKRIIAEHGCEYDLYEVGEEGVKGPLSCDYLIVLGGDGTILASIHSLEEPETPVLAISYGRGGYLADATPDEANHAVKSLLIGNYRLERLMRLDISIDGEFISNAVNEAYVSNSSPGKVVEFDLEVERLRLQNIVADGMVFSTPVGSTGYNSSLGGPLVDEELELIITTPVAPITNIKPLVFSPLRKIVMKCRRGPFSVLIDGLVRREFEGGEVEVTKSRHSTVLVRTSGVTLCERRFKRRLGI
ncbi:NAD kinase [Candidatus Calditenuaceae archaeon HR02]|nr:NAD kinase [Candidatus Calditenuaceae archaeon HR02]